MCPQTHASTVTRIPVRRQRSPNAPLAQSPRTAAGDEAHARRSTELATGSRKRAHRTAPGRCAAELERSPPIACDRPTFLILSPIAAPAGSRRDPLAGCATEATPEPLRSWRRPPNSPSGPPGERRKRHAGAGRTANQLVPAGTASPAGHTRAATRATAAVACVPHPIRQRHNDTPARTSHRPSYLCPLSCQSARAIANRRATPPSPLQRQSPIAQSPPPSLPPTTSLKARPRGSRVDGCRPAGGCGGELPAWGCAVVRGRVGGRLWRPPTRPLVVSAARHPVAGRAGEVGPTRRRVG